MLGAIMQPTYMPWLGYFDMIDQSDCFVIYDDVQLARRSWQVRNRIKTSQGELFLTIPIKKTKHRDDLVISEAEINNEEKWIKNHLRSIEMSYQKSPHFDSIFGIIEPIYNKKHRFLADFNFEIISVISKHIGINTELKRSSSLKEIVGEKEERLIQVCKSIGIKKYLSAPGSSSYLENESAKDRFVEANIELSYHRYEHPEYAQLFGSFLPYMGIFDLLFNVGFSNALEIIRSGRL